MWWSTFQKLATGQSQSPARRIILPLIYKPIPSHPSQPLPSLIPPTAVNNSAPFSTPSSESQTTAFHIPLWNQPWTENCWSFNHSPPSHRYLPSFCFGPFFLNPIGLNGVIKTDEDECFLEDSRTPTPAVWADSVKKKRKRKMNKHKLRKLRKRLRRKT
ncbi:unnamed protein product [Coffea canephora]|uniref:Small ribosomal subunit protein mS38 n=1 Tax=Coffea canephora TaxID=49390 RepID=A0A068V748_COFCA|nr:unnamed protein product [Coffea canephora]